MPITYAVMLIGTIAITGLGIPHLDLGFAGFYSKDAIIDSAYVASKTTPLASFAFICGVFAAGLTSFYSWRLIFMTFHGHAKWGDDAHHGEDHGHAHDAHGHDAHGHDDHGHGHGHDHKPHESPWIVILPLLVLAVGAVFAGYVFDDQFVGEGRAHFWGAAIFTLPSNHILDGIKSVPEWVVWAPLSVTAIGFVAAWWVYIAKEGLGARIAARRGPVWSFLYNKWYFDELYDFVFVRGAKALGDLFWKVGDQKIIDGLGPDGVAAVSAAVGRGAGKIQTGYVYHYAFIMLLGVAGLLSFALWAWG
jgi:NADH-quinone oxidoreductase subunit L